jgi:predicted nucleic acid-binding Zn finger protein
VERKRIEVIGVDIKIIEKEIRFKAMVESESQEGAYYLVEYNGAWTCTCPDHVNRGGKECKHIREGKTELGV